MKKLVHFLFFFLLTGFIHAQDCQTYGSATIQLDANNVQVGLLNSGDFWWNGNESKYTILTSESSTQEIDLGAIAALWFGAKSPNGNLKIAAQQYRIGNNTDFFPGPLEFGTNNVSLEDCKNWDKFWKVNKSDVEAHITDFNDNNTIENKISSIYSWPGKNNPFFTANNGFDLPSNHSLAPFFDKDQDGDYNPDKGDYPLIKGDQSIWWVFNDNSGPHRVTLSNPLSIEIQAMAYAEASDNKNIDNTTYYHFKITNQGSEPLLNTFMGLWTDLELGCLSEGYFGYSEDYQMMYAYNEDENEGNSICYGGIEVPNLTNPIMGIRQIENSDNPVSSFVVLERGSGPTSDPDIDFEYYNILQGKWKNGIPMTIGGNGYDPSSSDIVPFAFNGDPSEENAWSMCTSDLAFEDRSCVMSTDIGTLQPGQSITNSYAVVIVENQDYPCPRLTELIEAADDASNNLTSSTVEDNITLSFQISSNPASNILRINSEIPIHMIQLLNISGQVILEKTVDIQSTQYSLDIDNFQNGLYLVSVQDGLGRASVKKVIIQN
ncbi:MAG: T9SS type A sorting domain-containing protein [Saprospiraceae bacterium]|nr:T9SS type A sorting domain-containing protein [Saprospiraceae bacterium]